MESRKFKISQKSVIKEIAGSYMLMYVFSDLTDLDLQMQLDYYIEKEDFEYCEALKAEASLRGLKLKVTKT